MKENFSAFAVAVLVFISCSSDLTIVHVNDTHSHLFGSKVYCEYKSKAYQFDLGGYGAIMQVVDRVRSEKENTIFLHAGDLIQGTRYFREFQGKADIDLMNDARLDALALGNHEFDKGSRFLANLLKKADFPTLAANVEIDKNLELAKFVKPYVIKGSWPHKTAFIGIITPDTGSISSPGSGVRFNDPAETLRKTIKMLKKDGIDQIVVLSHLGYEEDVKLASEVSGIDVIIGGHSHTLLGYTGLKCLPSRADYPKIVKDPDGRDVLVAQAWDHARAVGRLDLKFDFSGEIVSHSGKILFPIKKDVKLPFPDKRSPFNEFIRLDENKAIEAKMKIYNQAALEKYKKVVATVNEDLMHGWEKGSDLAPMVADAIIWKLREKNIQVDVAMQNAGGVRKSIHKGEITLGEIFDVLPFFNYLAILKIKGKDLEKAFKRSIGQASKGIHQGAFPYLSGMKFDIVEEQAINFRIVKNGLESPVEPEKEYLFATDSYIAQGGNGYYEFHNVSKIEMTQFIVSDVFAEYCMKKKTLSKPEIRHSSLN